jgi:hypothetical protein
MIYQAVEKRSERAEFGAEERMRTNGTQSTAGPKIGSRSSFSTAR